MDAYLVAAIQLVLATPCLFLGMGFYKKQRRELDVGQRIIQRLWIVWSALIFLTVVLSIDGLWTTYVAAH